MNLRMLLGARRPRPIPTPPAAVPAPLAKTEPEPEPADLLCGRPHHRYPETLCTEPAGHYARDRNPHAGPYVIDGRECGGAAWDEPQEAALDADGLVAHSCFAHGKTCPCEAYRQLPHDEAVAQIERNRQAADRPAASPAP